MLLASSCGDGDGGAGEVRVTLPEKPPGASRAETRAEETAHEGVPSDVTPPDGAASAKAGDHPQGSEDSAATQVDGAQPSESESGELDLSKGHLQELIGDAGDIGELEAALPDLFDVDEQEKTVTINGSLLTREDAESLMDALDGMEVTIEVKTGGG